jgi:hypothetical protein
MTRAIDSGHLGRDDVLLRCEVVEALTIGAVMGLTFFGLRKIGCGRCSSLLRLGPFDPPPQA